MIRYFFRPLDPTPLAFIRIITGCLIVYTHLCYSFDLLNFFGPSAWYDTAAANRERREVPTYAPPMVWDDVYEPKRLPQMPDAPHRRDAVFAYVESIANSGNADPFLSFLQRVNNKDLSEIRNREGTASHALQGLAYISNLSSSENDRQSQLKVLADDTFRNDAIFIREPKLPIPDSPAIVRELTVDERKLFAAEAEAMVQSLPRDPNNQAIVLMFWKEMDYGQRSAMMQFLQSVAKLSPEDRAKRLEYFKYWNVDPDVTLRRGNPIFSVYFHLTEDWEITAAHYAILLCMILFTLGLFTRVTSVLTWLGLLCYIHRSQQTLFGMDTMMNITMIYLMLGNSGAVLSLDRLMAKYRVVKHALRRHKKLDIRVMNYLETPPKSISAGLSLKLLQIHFCFIYLAAGLSKLKGTAWWNTTAYWDTLVNPEFTMIYYQWYEDLVQILVTDRTIYAVLAAIAISFTFISEIGLPFLIWSRIRPYFIIVGLMLHFGVGAFMGLIVFSLFMMSMLLCYIPGCTFREFLFGRSQSLVKLSVTYNPADARQLRIVSLLLSTYTYQTAQVVELTSAAKPVVTSQDEKGEVTPLLLKEVYPVWHPLRYIAT